MTRNQSNNTVKSKKYMKSNNVKSTFKNAPVFLEHVAHEGMKYMQCSRLSMLFKAIISIKHNKV